MRLRLLSVAFLLSSVFTGVTWLVLQPSLFRVLTVVAHSMIPADPALPLILRLRSLLPFFIGLNFALVLLLAFGALQLTVGRPLRRVEETVSRLERLELDLPFASNSGPLQSRIETSLKRMADALLHEQNRTKQQLHELRFAHERLTRTQTELVSQERLATVGRLAAGIAHEVGNPLGGILGYLSLAQSRLDGQPEVVEFLHRIDGEVQRINQIVRGLLDLGRPPLDRMSAIPVKQLAESCIRLVRAGPDFENVEIDASETESNAIALAEAGPLSQVVLNLLINAAQAMHGTGRIAVRARLVQARVLVEVDDTGPGLSADVLPRVFEPFFTTKSGGQGTGLGLAVSHHLIATMGGQLIAANVPYGGARFTIDLPAASLER